MFVIRDVFTCRPGKARNLVEKFKVVMPMMEEMGASSTRIMTDAVSTYWTVVLELEVESVGAWMEVMEGRQDDERLKAMEGYMDLVTGGHREIFKVE
jgi:hypothetical protein